MRTRGTDAARCANACAASAITIAVREPSRACALEKTELERPGVWVAAKVRMRTSDIAIPVPCTVDWQSMTPADKGRFCGDCKKVVRDLSKLSAVEAKTLVQSAHGGDLCVRYVHDRHGKVFFEEDLALRSGLLPRSFLNRARRTAVLAATLAVPAFLAGCTSDPFGALTSDKNQEELTQNMGGMAEPNNPPIVPDAPDAAPDAPTTPDAGATTPEAAPPAADAGAAEPDASPVDSDAGPSAS